MKILTRPDSYALHFGLMSIPWMIAFGKNSSHIRTERSVSTPISIIVGIKYSASSVAGQVVPSPSTVHYRFFTEVDGSVVNQNANGLDLAPKP